MGIFSSIVKGVVSAAKTFGGPIGSVIGGTVGDIIDNKKANDKFDKEAQFKLSTMREQNAFNQAEAEKARNFNAAEAEKARLFNQAEAEKARQFNHDAAIEMFNLENAYNTPAAQIQRMRAAGLNPALMTGQQLVAASGSAPSSSPASSPAASGTSASAGSGLSSPVLINPSRTHELAMEASQLRSLQLQNRAQELSNKEKSADLKAKEEPREDSYSYIDDNGNWVIDITPPKNYWQEQRDKSRNEARLSALNVDEKKNALNFYNDNKEWLNKMPYNEFLKLAEDIRTSNNANNLAEHEFELLKKYGISGKDSNMFTAMLRSALSNPDGLANVFNAIITAAQTLGKTAVKRNMEQIINLLR